MATHNSGAAHGGPSMQPIAPIDKAGTINMLLPIKHLRSIFTHSLTLAKFIEECFSPSNCGTPSCIFCISSTVISTPVD